MDKPALPRSFGALLKRYRRAAGLTQEALAERAGYSTAYVSKLEQGVRVPLAFTVDAFAEAMQLDPAERSSLELVARGEVAAPILRLLPRTGAPDETTVALPREHLPLPRNPYFTGRGALLESLHQQLQGGKQVALTQAISGLGGIGKTQAALEYAYRYREHYAEVFWLLAETRDTLVSGVRTLSSLLQLPDEQDQQKLLDAFKRWLQSHRNWLLILDNLEDLDLLPALLPPTHQGAVLLTTRRGVTEPLAQALLLEHLPAEDGILFLLKRAKRLPLEGALEAAALAEREQAREINSLLGGLPLALDQAGAYILETGCSLSSFLLLATERQAAILQRRGALALDHPGSVTTTLLLAVTQVRQQNKAAAELLCWCAFLAPEDIPEELLTQGAASLAPPLRAAATDPLLLDEAISTLRRYSLLRRDAEERTLSLHRLVQVVLRENLGAARQRQWAERVVHMVSQVVPKGIATNWKQGERYVLHTLVCASHIETWNFIFPEAAALLSQTGRYLYERAAYGQALPLLQRGLAMREQMLGPDHPDVAESLDHLANLYHAQGQYAEALPLYERALSIREQQLGATHPEVARSLNNLAQLLFHSQGEYSKVLLLYERALTIREQQLGPDHLDVAESLDNLADLYRVQGKYAEVLLLCKRALTIREQQLGTDHPLVAESLHALAQLYRDQGQYNEALPLAERALSIQEQQLGPDHPDVAESLHTLAGLYQDQGHYSAAHPLYERALAIEEHTLGPNHPYVARSLNNLALLYHNLGQYDEAVHFAEQALAIYEQQLGPDHLYTAVGLNNLAAMYCRQGQYSAARPLYERALIIQEQRLGLDHPRVANILNHLATLYHALGQYAEALPLAQQALAIREQQLGATHPEVARSLTTLAQLYRAQDQYDQAQPCYERALAIFEQALPDHPDTILCLENYAALLRAMYQPAQVERLDARAQAIRAKQASL